MFDKAVRGRRHVSAKCGLDRVSGGRLTRLPMTAPRGRRDRGGTGCTALTTTVRAYRLQEPRHNRAAGVIGVPIDDDLQEIGLGLKA